MDGRYKQKLEISTKEVEKFTNIGLKKEMYTYLKEQIFKEIYLKILNIDSNYIDIVASLPMLNIEINNNDTVLNYSNEICIVKKSLNNESEDVILHLDISENLVQNGFITKHAKASIIDSTIYLPLYKGWPVIGTKEFDKSNIDESYNPFIESFYEKTPVFYAIKKDGSNEVFGDLPPIFKKQKSGYFNFKPNLTANKENLFVHCGGDNFIHVFLKEELKLVDSIKIKPFYVQEHEELKSNKILESPLEYLLSSTNSKSELLGMICNDNNLWLLFNYDYNLYLMTYDLKNKTNDLQIITNDYKQSPKVKYQLFTNLSDIQIMKIESKKSLVDISFFQKHGSN
jgi:hypothetical protein